MKKLLYTLLAVSIIFSACKKEDEVTPTNTNNTGNNNTGNNTSSIIGKWNAIYYSYDYYEDGEHLVGDVYFGVDLDETVPFYHLDFKINDELIITTWQYTDGGDELVYINTPYYINGDDFYVNGDEWPFNINSSATPNNILLVNNTNLNFSMLGGELIFYFERIQ